MENVGLNESEILACQKELTALLLDLPSIEGAVLSSADGLMVACEDKTGKLEGEMIAAMSSSMISLADTLAGQAGRAEVDNIISEAKSSTLVVLHAGDLILTVIGKPEVQIGLVLAAAKKAAQGIHQDTQAFSEGVTGMDILKDPAALLERVKKEMDMMKKGT
ncbi:MAG: roadblock/LC7 domain-containing protein [Ghiorsea sp.]|nr:roadblock/LC7 domain-containing protein [Ghiorsea sp.]